MGFGISYLICKKCGRYYELQEGESPDDFDECQCGGNLFYSDYIDSPINDSSIDESRDSYKKTSNKSLLNNKVFFIMVLCLILPLIIFVYIVGQHFFIPDPSKPTYLGSDSRGYVIKEIYPKAYSADANTKTFIIVTGIHPREKQSKDVINDLIKEYPLKPDFRIVHYDITVTNNPDNYTVGRTNGEGLAAQYILPDIQKSNADIVIICHNHKPGYGEGYYIATPKMDEKSVKFAETVNQTLPEFNYYKTNKKYISGSSSGAFANPLASAGYRTVVYEIPEIDNYNKAYNMSYLLFDTCFKLI